VKLSERIRATGEIPPQLRRVGFDGDSADEALAFLAARPEFDHDLIEREGEEPVFDERQRRTEQSRLRRDLLDAYDGRCAITGCDVPVLLDAAHLRGWRDHNTVQDAVLLRVDLHRLLDAGLLRIERDYRVRLAPEVGGDYRQFDGVALRLPRRRDLWPVAG
jgi:putative restriction endonuclease